MNDVYVGLFIVAAYTVFAALWTGWWRGRGGVLGRDADHRRPARPRAREQVGRRLRDRRAWCCSSSSGARSAGSLAILGLIGLTGVLGYMAISVPEGQRVRQPDVPADHDRADPARGRRRGLPPDRLDRRGDALRGRRARRRSAALVFFGALGDRPARPADRRRLARDHAAAARDRCSASARSRSSGVFGLGGPARVRAARRAARRRTTRPRCLEPPGAARRTAGSAPAGCSGLPVRLGGRLPASSSRSAVYVVSYIPWAMIENHQIVPGWPAGPHRPDAARPDRRRCTATTTA